MSGQFGGRAASVSGLAQVAHGLEPAEDLLDSFADPLAGLISRGTKQSGIERGALVAFYVLRNVSFDSLVLNLPLELSVRDGWIDQGLQHQFRLPKIYPYDSPGARRKL